MDRNVEDADRVVKKIVSSGGKAISFKADVTKKAELQAMVEETKKKLGGIDILVNNAGTESPAALAVDITEANWDRVLNVNLKGPFLCCQAVIPTMMQQKKRKNRQHRFDRQHKDDLFRRRRLYRFQARLGWT